MMMQLRSLTLVNATGAALRTATFEERPHLVVPVVALVGDEVVHAANSETPELVPAEEIARGFFSWCGRPVVGDHPQIEGRYVSANPASVAERFAFGRIDNPRYVNGRMLLDAWIDRARAERLGGEALDVLRRAEAGEPIEVSVGVMVEVEARAGVAPNGKRYVGIWRELQGDHLAMLPAGSTGACSIAMGCGAPRVMRHLVSAEGLSLVDTPANVAPVTPPPPIVREKAPPPPSPPPNRVTVGTAMAEKPLKSTKEHPMPLKERLKALLTSLTVADASGEESPGEEAAELIGYQTLKTMNDGCAASCNQIASTIAELIAAESPAEEGAEGTDEAAEEEVEAAQLASIQALCMSMMSGCMAMSKLCDDLLAEEQEDAPPQPAYGGTPMYTRSAVGKRHSAADQKMVQTVHDHAVSLGAECAPMKAAAAPPVKDLKAASCGCATEKTDSANGAKKESEMSKIAERVKALIACDRTPFTAADEAMLNTATEERLTALESAFAAPVAPAAPAVQEGQVIVPADELAELRGMAAEGKAAKAARHAELLALVKTTKQEAYTEAELTALSLAELERVAKLVKVAARPRDFSGKVLPSLIPEGEQQDVPPPPDMAKTARVMRGMSEA